jgi:hypothetical protein
MSQFITFAIEQIQQLNTGPVAPFAETCPVKLENIPRSDCELFVANELRQSCHSTTKLLAFNGSATKYSFNVLATTMGHPTLVRVPFNK